MAVLRFCLGVFIVAAAFARPGLGQTPEEIVRWIYLSRAGAGAHGAQGLEYLSDPARRAQFFTQRMVAFLAANDSHGGDIATACLDFAPDIPGNDFDAGEIARTLVLSHAGGAGNQSVTATFTSFGQPARITYDFVAEDGFMRIDDIAGPGYRLSRIPCTARQAAAPVPTGSGEFCYDTGNSELRLRPAPDGSAAFTLESWQGGGHSCGAEGRARSIAGGWLWEESRYGRPCRLQIALTPDRGIRLGDPGHDCKMMFCGQRAVLDGLAFPPASQVDCASLPHQ
ncbi:MAG: hypothetical protein ACK5MY_03685 [Jhaorihella sp.]